jgi:hypothetical protein
MKGPAPMKTLSPIFVAFPALLLLGSCGQPVAQAAPEKPVKAATNANTGTVVVELYQSQGCSSCPPANAALNAIADRADVIALSFAVTYWDRLGWKDTFADPAYTDRQHAYAAALKNDSVYTPQVVLNGKTAIVGNGDGELNGAVAKAARLGKSPTITAANGSVTIGAGKGSADIVLIHYDPRSHMVSIRAGENGGKKLPHKNIVRQLTTLGSWSGKAVTFKVPTKRDAAWKAVVIVQAKKTGPILAAGWI